MVNLFLHEFFINHVYFLLTDPDSVKNGPDQNKQQRQGQPKINAVISPFHVGAQTYKAAGSYPNKSRCNRLQ